MQLIAISSSTTSCMLTYIPYNFTKKFHDSNSIIAILKIESFYCFVVDSTGLTRQLLTNIPGSLVTNFFSRGTCCGHIWSALYRTGSGYARLLFYNNNNIYFFNLILLLLLFIIIIVIISTLTRVA